MSILQVVPSSVTAECAVLETPQQFAELKDVWEDLSADVESASAFASWDWVFGWWEHFGYSSHGISTDCSLLVVTARDREARLVGLLLMHFAARRGSFMKPIALVPVGFTEVGIDALTEEAPVLLRRGYETEAFEAAMACLIKMLPSSTWDIIKLRPPHGLSIRPRKKHLFNVTCSPKPVPLAK